MIIDYIRNELKFKTVGVHGESLGKICFKTNFILNLFEGGFVANYIASKKKLDFLCADRTFSSLSSIANFGFHKALFFLFKSVTTWNRNSSLNYLKSNCYKIVILINLYKYYNYFIVNW